MKKKKLYSSIDVAVLELTAESPVLASSIIETARVKANGQEIGETYDFSSTPTGEDAGKQFNHEWE